MKKRELNIENAKMEKIRRYYDERVSQYGTSGKATLLDDNMRLLETETVTSWLSPNDKVLDVFCGNGVSTIEFAKHCKSIVGLDFSDKMIKSAHKLLKTNKSLSKNTSFEKGNILDVLEIFPPGGFNTVISVRGLINLPSWKLQQKVLVAIHKMLAKGGKFIFLEGSKDGLQKINELRKSFSLPLLEEPWYDNHFDTAKLLKFMSKYFDILDSRNLNIYFLISRIFYPFAVFPEKPAFDHLCNTVARLVTPYAETALNTTLLICKCFIKK